ncbi:MAG: hypothetical protein Kow0019_15620 [Methanobacteriaceae archaeon]
MNNRLLFLGLSLLLAVILCNGVSAADNNSANIDAQIMDVNIPFVENQGQTSEEVSYYAKTFYGTSYITQDGITHQIQGKDNKTLVLKEQFLDSNGNPISFQAQGEEPSPSRVSYLKGNDPDKWKTNLPTYNLINLGEIYPGIVVKLRAKGSNIEKLFFISPGSNPENIRIQIQGADQLETDEEGQLNILATGFEQVSMSPPQAYQDQDKVEVKYQTDGNTYQFQIGNYNQQKQLIIDPTLQYSTYLGGTDTDFGSGIAVDNNGNAYITGYTYSGDFPVTPGVYQANNAGYGDVFISKINPTGTALLYSTYLGGTGYDYGYDIAIDNNGNAYITGVTYSTDFPVTLGAYQANKAGLWDAFITKINSTGTELLYSTYLGGTQYEYQSGIAIDNNGNTYITGYTNSTDFPVTPGAYQANKAGSLDAFITKINSTGTELLYSTYLGGKQSDSGNGIAIDNNGNAYITGTTYSTDFPVTPGAYQANNAGGYDAFISKINSTGTALLYSTYLGGTEYDYGTGIAIDNTGNAYITGGTDSTDFPVTPDAYQASNAGISDAFITKINSTGTTLLYSTYLGGTEYDYGTGIAIDNIGNAYITGGTDSTDFPVTPDAYQNTKAGENDAFITKINSTGTTLLYSTYLGGKQSDSGYDIAIDNTGNAYITGTTNSTDFPVTPDAYQTTRAGGTDGFVAKFGFTIKTVTQTSSKTSFAGKKVELAAQVEDENGNPVNEGQVRFSVNGSIVGTADVVNGQAIYTYQIPRSWKAGSYPILAEYLGTGNYQASSGTATLNVKPKSSLYLTITGKKNIIVGETVTYTIKVGNHGPDTARDVVMTYQIPRGLEFTGASVDKGSWSYKTTTRTLTWNIGDVPVGDPYLWLDLKILKAGTYQINPRLSTSTYDPTIAENTESITVNAAEKPGPGPKPKPDTGKSVPMQKTGTPLAVLLLALLMVLGGIVSSKK